MSAVNSTDYIGKTGDCCKLHFDVGLFSLRVRKTDVSGCHPHYGIPYIWVTATYPIGLPTLAGKYQWPSGLMWSILVQEHIARGFSARVFPILAVIQNTIPRGWLLGIEIGS